MDLYIYDSLPGENYIRTATILPGKAEDDIIIDLATIPFLESGLAEHTALSYAWGSPEIHIYVKVRGTNDNSLGLGHRHLGQIGVSKSLATALCDLRRGASPRTMWIDALCINQSNHEEKANQVTKMGDIFRRAAQVVAYIGPETDESTKLMDYMEHLGNAAELDWSTGSLNVVDLRHKWNGMRLLDDNQNLLIDADLQTGLYQLLCLPWFERLWIRQEIYLSALKAIVTCGFCGVRWRLFYRAWTCLYNHFARTDSSNPHYLRKLWHNSSLLEQDRFTSLCVIRHSFRGAKCTDPRDRLFAVLELLPENEKVLITVDYKKLPREIYKEATLKWMEANRDLSILRECELRDGWAAPTWVPNWGADSQVEGGAGMRLGTSWLAAILDSSQARKDGVMRVVGINTTVIEDLRPSGISITSTNIVAKLHDLFGSIQMEGDYVAGGTLREAYAASLMDGKFPTAIEPICDDFSPIEDVIEIVQLACSVSLRNVLPLGKTSLTNMRFFCAQKQLFRGNNGYVGMALPAARIGDKFYTFPGCNFPLALPDIGEGKMQVVGSCYMPGAMENEKLLGPLPTVFETTYVRATGRLGFRNRLTKKITYKDPRLSMLPLNNEEREQLNGWSVGDAFIISLDTLQKLDSQVKWVELV